jgi:hypothetical protein
VNDCKRFFLTENAKKVGSKAGLEISLFWQSVFVTFVLILISPNSSLPRMEIMRVEESRLVYVLEVARITEFEYFIIKFNNAIMQRLSSMSSIKLVKWFSTIIRGIMFHSFEVTALEKSIEVPLLLKR